MSAKRQTEEALVLALASGATAEDAARQCGTDEKAVRRKLADAKFRRRVVAARATLTERTCGLLTAAGLTAAETLVELARGDGPPAVRLAAAKAVLDMGMKLREVVDLETQVTDLERRLDKREPWSNRSGNETESPLASTSSTQQAQCKLPPCAECRCSTTSFLR